MNRSNRGTRSRPFASDSWIARRAGPGAHEIWWASDENFNNIIRTLQRRAPDTDLVRVQDVGLSGGDDVAVLRWCAANNRILLTHDKATIPRYAYERIVESRPMPSVFIIPLDLPVGVVADEVLLVTRYSAG